MIECIVDIGVVKITHASPHCMYTQHDASPHCMYTQHDASPQYMYTQYDALKLNPVGVNWLCGSFFSFLFFFEGTSGAGSAVGGTRSDFEEKRKTKILRRMQRDPPSGISKRNGRWHPHYSHLQSLRKIKQSKTIRFG